MRFIDITPLALPSVLKPRCAVLIINMDSGDIVHWLTFESHITELYDVAFLPGAQRSVIAAAQEIFVSGHARTRRKVVSAASKRNRASSLI